MFYLILGKKKLQSTFVAVVDALLLGKEAKQTLCHHHPEWEMFTSNQTTEDIKVGEGLFLFLIGGTFAFRSFRSRVMRVQPRLHLACCDPLRRHLPSTVVTSCRRGVWSCPLPQAMGGAHREYLPGATLNSRRCASGRDQGGAAAAFQVCCNAQAKERR